ncbi:DUF6153 family protein [Blastococcus sp. CT_GayMR16]|uniref:DUF6153 family protein n=1 Tax=Blastococcus sp. CT_GayMR16 TaxID=2559607 RepID=UPI00107444B2|nr:DUF6153 family protein [Blastococcus sp. CT_GayMR16]TFV91128.1 hypothetical protein E4P38_00485 [Blastococcus sp. CT_GayMR16]
MLLLLAAVLSMHGIPAMAAEGSTAPAMTHAPYASATSAVADSVAGLSADDGAAVHPFVAGDVAPDGQSAPHEMAMHAFAACLAVILAGIGLLTAAIFARRGDMAAVRTVLGGVPWARGWFRPPRPPDLSALCLLRI